MAEDIADATVKFNDLVMNFFKEIVDNRSNIILVRVICQLHLGMVQLKLNLGIPVVKCPAVELQIIGLQGVAATARLAFLRALLGVHL